MPWKWQHCSETTDRHLSILQQGKTTTDFSYFSARINQIRIYTPLQDSFFFCFLLGNKYFILFYFSFRYLKTAEATHLCIFLFLLLEAVQDTTHWIRSTNVLTFLLVSGTMYQIQCRDHILFRNHDHMPFTMWIDYSEVWRYPCIWNLVPNVICSNSKRRH